METIHCPSCQRTLEIQHPGINLLYCEHCFKVLEHIAGNTRLNHACAIIHPKTSSIQPGTTGKWQDRSFSVTGRCLLYFNESVFNYWTIVFSDNTLGWLLEGYGLFFMVADLSNQSEKYRFEKMNTVGAGHTIRWEQSTFLVSQHQPCKKIELEGQTYLPIHKTPFSVIELDSSSLPGLHCLYADEEHCYMYPIEAVTQEQLNVSLLRNSADEPFLFNCKHCEAIITVHHYPYTQSVVCDSCGMAHYMKYSGFELVNTHFETRKKRNIVFSIGDIGQIHGTHYTVRGYAEKKESNIYQSKWREYYLFSNTQGYAILSEYDGHFIFIREAADRPVVSDPGLHSILFKDRLYDKYNRYKYSIVHAAGAFPHNMFNNGDTECFEYIAPPYLLIYEQDPNDGIRWYEGEHMDHATLKKNFTPSPQLPYKKGVGAVSPTFTDRVTKGGLFLAAMIVFVLMLSVHMIIGQSKQHLVVLPATSYYFTDSTDELSISGTSFTLTKASSNLAFEIVAPVSNSWFALSADLINKDNGKIYSFEQGVEFYYGVTEGESWSEGSTTEKYHLNAIPPGRYLLEMKGVREKQYLNALTDFSVQVTYDVDEDANIWWAMGLMAIWPVACFFLIDYNKQRRWMNSPFSNYSEE